MAQVKLTDRYGVCATVAGQSQMSLMQIIRASGREIEAVCDGSMSCGTCHVWVDKSWASALAPPSKEELDLLESLSAFNREQSRLSCQIEFCAELDGIAVTIAPSE